MNEFYYWLQRELEKDLRKIYEIHSIRVFDKRFCIWFLSNKDSISIPLNVMENIFNSGKSIKELSAIIDSMYLAKIKSNS